MTMRMAWAGGVAVALASGPGAANAPPGFAGGGFRPPAQQVVCESRAFRRQDCPADTRGGVRLLQQTGGLCTRGTTWGYGPGRIWVDNGCRAIFAAVGGPGGVRPAARLIVCASWRSAVRCPAHVTRRPRIEVIAGRCREHQSWGWDRRGLWVSGGCRARFLLG